MLVLVAMLLAMAALSRAAEYRADVGAIAMTSPEAVTRWMVDDTSGEMPTGWRGVMNTHPYPEQRAAHIARAIDGRQPRGGRPSQACDAP